MHIQILKECGHSEALLGLSLSFGRPVGEMVQVAERLYCKGDSESKFLRFIVVWLDITAPRYWWVEMREYRIGLEVGDWETQSESTIHSLKALWPLEQASFAQPLDEEVLRTLNYYLKCMSLEECKNFLPEGFLQRRIVQTNYQALRRIIRQRRNHKLNEWQIFTTSILEQIEHREYVQDLETA